MCYLLPEKNLELCFKKNSLKTSKNKQHTYDFLTPQLSY